MIEHNPDLTRYQIKKNIQELYRYLCYYQATKNSCKNHYHTFLNLCLDYRDKEIDMIEHYYLQFIINDILATGEYTLEGISHSTRIPIDILTDILTGVNKVPSYQTVFLLLDFHFSVKTNEYCT